MFKLESNKEIGKYLSNLIIKKYPSVRQFGKACIEADGRIADNEEMRKASNRLSQILKGTKSLQISDLPIFTKLLDVSCEELLSAGKCFTTTSNHLTNYSIATSKDPKLWNEYVEREDKLILNADEYGKTVIDYALNFQNYDFLKFLVDNKYIWFVGTDKSDLFHYGFGAGTNIERNPLRLHNLNILETKMQEHHELRMKMITLAIEHNDITMLTKLHAREIPPLYQACFYTSIPDDINAFFDPALIAALANASDEILEYFSNEFEITDYRDRTNRFVFPYISELIDVLLENNNDYAEWVIKNAIKHNQYVYDHLCKLFEPAVKDYKKQLGFLKHEDLKGTIEKSILEDVHFCANSSLIKYLGRYTADMMVSNLVRVSATSNNVKITHLIQELNDLYSKIKTITPKI